MFICRKEGPEGPAQQKKEGAVLLVGGFEWLLSVSGYCCDHKWICRHVYTHV